MSSPLNNLKLERKTPLSRFRASERWIGAGNSTDFEEYRVKEHLARHPELLEDFLLENVSVKFLQDVLEKVRTKPTTTRPLPVHQQPIKLTHLFSEQGIEQFCRRILYCAKDKETCDVINELSHVVGRHIEAEGFSLYLVRGNGQVASVYKPGKEFTNVGPVGKYMTVSAHVACEKKSLNIADLQQDARFPKGICVGDDTTHQVISIPVVLEDGRCYAVAEFTRGWRSSPFSGAEFEFSVAVFRK